MILNWNQSLGGKNDKILSVQSLKNILRMKDGEEGKNKRMEKREDGGRDYWCFFTRKPCSGVQIPVVLSLSLVLFCLSFLLLAPSLILLLPLLVSHTLSYIYSCTTLFLDLTCAVAVVSLCLLPLSYLCHNWYPRLCPLFSVLFFTSLPGFILIPPPPS